MYHNLQYIVHFVGLKDRTSLPVVCVCVGGGGGIGSQHIAMLPVQVKV